jgi:RNA-directed DNA polymerase
VRRLLPHRRPQHLGIALRGWHQFFRIASPGEQFVLHALDAHIRRRLRAILLHHCKRRPTIVRNLIALGVKRWSAWQGVYAERRSLWALSHIPQVDRALRPQFFADRGLVSLVDLHHRWHEDVVAATHEQLALESG